jgi:LmbE family N-acetylglucosaminyl deacetylase
VVRAVVLSPHLDDAALSLGAAIHRAARAGGDVVVLTVLGGEPASSVPATDWDARKGARTAGEAIRQRRTEDERACAALGVRPVWLPFLEPRYGGPPDDGDVWRQLHVHLAPADCILLPGFPLHHRDHAWLARLVVPRLAPAVPAGLYVEQPYGLRSGAPGLAEPLRGVLAGPLRWTVARSAPRDWLAKARAVHEYRSQRPLLRRFDRLVVPALVAGDARRRGEPVAWLTAPASWPEDPRGTAPTNGAA